MFQLVENTVKVKGTNLKKKVSLTLKINGSPVATVKMGGDLEPLIHDVAQYLRDKYSFIQVCTIIGPNMYIFITIDTSIVFKNDEDRKILDRTYIYFKKSDSCDDYTELRKRLGEFSEKLKLFDKVIGFTTVVKCPTCSKIPRKRDKFCSDCGTKL